MKTLLLFFVFLSIVGSSIAQTTLVLQPDAVDGKDAEIWSLAPTENFGDWHELKANAWTWDGEPGIQRALFQFDLSAIPEGVEILSAKLFLYATDTLDTQLHSGDNDAWIKRITEPWDESTVTWNSQPNTTYIHKKALHQSSYGYQDYFNINVLLLVNDMIAFPDESYGFMLELKNENIYRRMTFKSSDQDLILEAPKLIITYDYPDTSSSDCITLKPGSEGIDAELWSLEPTTNFGDWHELKANAWTWDGEAGIQRTLLKFDMSSLPEGAVIDEAYLNLFAVDSPDTQLHYGLNKSVISRVTSEWDEYSVTWNTQPTSTNINRVILPVSPSGYQNYTGINVSSLVQDMITYGNNGFLIRLGNESYYRRLTFASGDYSNPDKHPELVICYHLDSVPNRSSINLTQLNLYPNPVTNELNIELNSDLIYYKINLYSFTGQLVYSKDISGNTIKINMNDFMPGLYIVKITTNEGELISKFIKE